MRSRLFRQFVAICGFLGYLHSASAQNCIPTYIQGTTINLACNQTCSDLVFQIPHIKSTSNYAVNSVAYTPYPFVTTAPAQFLPCSSQDDKYFDVTTIPFSFCFYDSLFNKLVVSTNGSITFDISNAQKGSNWTLNTGMVLPFEGSGSQGTAGSCPTPVGARLPKAGIFGPFCDIFPQSGDPIYKIEARVQGTAPCRKFLVSFSQVPMFGCTNLRLTSQIVLHESTGIIEIFIQNKPSCSSNGGLAIVGIQNYVLGTPDEKAVTAPGRGANNGPWSTTNEGWRFTPSGPGSRFVRSDLLDMTGAVVSAADTITTVNGLLDVTFPNFCAPAGSNQFVVRTIFSACDNAATQLESLDTITITRTNNLNATGTSTNTACGPPNGTITITVPPGAGTPPYDFILDGGAPVTGPSPHTFTGVAQGPHTVVVNDASAGCTSTINLNVNITTVLNATTSFTGTSCPGVSNGSITVTTASGTGPYAFVLDGGAPQNGNLPFTFSNLSSGNHTVVVSDLSNGCVTNTITINIPAGPPITTTASKTDVLCNGMATGTITVAQPSAGTPPFEYSLDGITWQTSPTFTGLPAGTYTVYFRESNGCNGTTQITIAEPPVLSATSSTTPVLCNGQSNGTITVTSNGGVAPYEYSLNGGGIWQSSNVFNVAAGPYTVTIRDVNNCITTTSITVTEPMVLTAAAIATNATCNGGDDGVITISSSGGSNTTSYSLDGINFQPSHIFNVGPGNYIVTVKDNQNCTATVPVTVGLTNDLTFTPQADATICEGTNTQLQLVSNGLQYAWSPATGLSSTTIPDPVANPATTTEYIATITYGRCTADDTVIVNVNPAPVPDAGADGYICFGQTYQLQGAGGTSYQWSPSTYLDDPTSPNAISSAAKDIVYTLSIIADGNGCASLVTDEMKLDVTAPIKVTTYPFDTVAYNGDQFLLLAVPSDSDVISYSWSPALGLSDPAIPNPVVTTGAVGDVVQYQVTTSTIAGCKGFGYVTVKVYKGPDIYVPTAFTPNNDGKNDLFIPFPVGIKALRYFRVFNRWGHPVFATTTLHQGWDGKIGGIPQGTGTYVWMVEVVTNEDKIITKKGVVTLIR